jgi:uncharacterized membrane protein
LSRFVAAVSRAKGLWPNLSQSLGFIPGLFAVGFGVLGVALVEVDRHVDFTGVALLFSGDGSAARTVLSVIAGSLITVAGLTFSITMVVLQLASSQFSPRILRTFFGDRVTQVTIGTFVGTFVYAILVLRAVGSYGSSGFVPRISVTVASLLGIAAVGLLIVFLNHVSRMVQVSHVTADIAHDTLARTDRLYPQGYGEPVEDADADGLLAGWHSVEPGRVLPKRPGYVQRVGIDELVSKLPPEVERVAVTVCPGDFVSAETTIVEVWPEHAAERCHGELGDAVSIASERDLDQDVDFGIRQLADTAMKAMSPAINDPATAVTCIGYLRSILVRLTERADLPRIRRFPDRDLVVVLRRRTLHEHFESLLQVNRYVDGDAWVIGELLQLVRACVAAARAAGAHDRMSFIAGIGTTIGEQAEQEVATDRDREAMRRLLLAVDHDARG